MNWRGIVCLGAIATAACGSSSPAGPGTVTTSAATTSIPPAPLPIATVAPYVGQTVNSTIEQALTGGLTRTGSGRWTANCPAGGTAQVELAADYQVQFVEEIQLTDTGVTYTDCETDITSASLQPFLSRLLDFVVAPVEAQSKLRIFIRGRVTTKGKWRPPLHPPSGPLYRDAPVQVTGSLAVNQLNCGNGNCGTQIGPIDLNCGINGTVCSGSIGGVGVTQGPPDTPPSPTPTTTSSSTTTSVSATTSTVAATTTVPASLAGTWNVTDANGTGQLALTQNGSTLGGSVLGVGILPAGAIVTSVGGSISGSTVNLTIGIRIVIPAGGITTTCTGTDVFVLTVNSSTRMSGTETDTASCVITGSPVPIPNPPPTTVSGPVTFTR